MSAGSPLAARGSLRRNLAKARFFKDLALSRLLRRPTPLLLYWFVTNRCNYRCSYCYGMFYRDPRPDLPTDVMLRMIDEMAACGVRRVNLLGGEPLLREDIGLLVGRLAERGISACLLTNGSLLPGRIDQVAQVDEVGLSIDGREATHDALRGKGAFKQLVEAIACCRLRGIKVVLTYTMVAQNIDDLDFVMESARQWGVQVTVNVAHGRVAGAKDLSVTRADDAAYRRALARLVVLQAEGFPVFRAPRTLRLMQAWRDFHVDTAAASPAAGFPQCRFGTCGATLRSDGTLVPCFLNDREAHGLGVPEAGFAAAWKHCQQLEHCGYCHVPCFIEYNAIFALSVPVLYNAFSKLCLPTRPHAPRGGT